MNKNKRFDPILSVTSFGWFNYNDTPWNPTSYAVRLAVIFFLFQKTFEKDISHILEHNMRDLFFIDAKHHEKYYDEQIVTIRRNLILKKITDNDKNNKRIPLIPHSLWWVNTHINTIWVDPLMQERLDANYKKSLPHQIILALCDQRQNNVDYKNLLHTNTNLSNTISNIINNIKNIFATSHKIYNNKYLR